MEIFFYIADDVRQEQGGKLTLLGLYPHRSFATEVNPEEKKRFETEKGFTEPVPFALSKLCFVFSIKSKPGKYNLSFTVENPDKTIREMQNFEDVFMEEHKTHTLIIQAVPFLYTHTGTYIARLFVNGKAHDFPFNVSTTSTTFT